jgi:Uma2 family endonuclease
MSIPVTRTHFTEDEYLAIERASDERHEYIDGRIYAMAGESDGHNTICVNLARELSLKLKGTLCRTHAQNMKVRSGPEPKTFHSPKGFYSYPDALVVCGEKRFHDEFNDVLLNPNVIIEVLSKSTEAFDRGEKFLRYRTWLPTFSDYILVSQADPIVEYYRRQPNGDWILTTIDGLDNRLNISSINCVLELGEIYDGIVFPASPEQ